MLGAPTFLSVFVALLIASLLGPLLGRAATQWFSGRGLSNLLTEIRGAFLPFLIAPLLYETTKWAPWLVIGVVVGLMQAIAVGRWVARRSGEWSPALLGGIALGRSRAALLSAQATARGAVIATLALTLIQVILLESLLAALALKGFPPQRSIGESLFHGAGAGTIVLLATSSCVIIATEMATSWLFQRRSTRSSK